MHFTNESSSPTAAIEFEIFVEGAATALKKMRELGITESNLGELMCWLGQDPEEVGDSAWEETFPIDEKFDNEVDHIVAQITHRIH